MTRTLLLAALLSTATGCVSDDATTTAPRAQAAQSTSADDHARCVQLMTKSRTCSDQFIPELVDARAAADQPAGIAAAVKDNRDGVIAQARQEWANDSTDPAIDASCKTAPIGDDASSARSCLAQSDCGAFVACAVPVFAKHLSK